MQNKKYSFNFIKKAMVTTPIISIDPAIPGDDRTVTRKPSWGNSFIFGKALGEKDNPRSRLAEEKPRKKGFALND